MIRHATIDDIDSITNIYNECIIEGGFTGDLTPLSVNNRIDWFNDHKNNHKIFVFIKDSNVIGYVALSPYRKGREAFKSTCEINYYISKLYRGQGIGKQLIAHGINSCKESDMVTIIAIILSINKNSIDILTRFNFKECGRIPKAAYINNQYIDHVYLHLTCK